jgi:hypothetical protein
MCLIDTNKPFRAKRERERERERERQTERDKERQRETKREGTLPWPTHTLGLLSLSSHSAAQCGHAGTAGPSAV